MATKTRAAKKTPTEQNLLDYPYTPETWSPAQLQAHRATTMEGAFHVASCLASGWYRRAVTIDYQITKDNDERYMVRPSEVSVVDGWAPVYEIRAVQA